MKLANLAFDDASERLLFLAKGHPCLRSIMRIACVRLLLAASLALTVWSCRTGKSPKELQLTAGPSASRSPTWSPDGTRLAFESDRSGSWDIYVLDVKTGVVDTLIRSRASNRYPAWSPDGERLVFVSDRGGRSDLHLYDVGTEAIERLAEIPGEEFFPAWSPDGREVAFTRQLGDSFELISVDVGDREARALVNGSGRDLWPRWSPDGRRLAFFSRRDTVGEDDEIYILDGASRDPGRITNRQGHDFCPAWSPTGTRLVVVSVEPRGDRSLRILDGIAHVAFGARHSERPHGRPYSEALQEQTRLAFFSYCAPFPAERRCRAGGDGDVWCPA